MDDDEVFRIAILDAGPVGLEAALYGRYLGYSVTLLDEREVCAAFGSETLLDAPFRHLCTPLGLAALDAQNQAYRHPAADQILTVRAWIAEYCLPLSKTDLLADTLRLGSHVVAIEFQADDETYQLASRGSDGSTISETFDYIIDTRFAGLSGDALAAQHFAAAATDDFFEIAADGTTLDFRGATDQIRRIYALIGERDGLNLYESLSQFQI
jgi:hypothetical protein